MMESFQVQLYLRVFFLSAADGKESFYRMQCQHRDREKGGLYVLRSSHS